MYIFYIYISIFQPISRDSINNCDIVNKQKNIENTKITKISFNVCRHLEFKQIYKQNKDFHLNTSI